ncbi:MAG TPA: mechanosensitive ion channel domain-containing protein [Sedimentisphaerales bacterium]|nr:mechanosensitive ion channel domain-containing protein [Sedimentisphaerales bacterium]
MNSAIFAVCLIITSSVCLGAEPPQGAATNGREGQDANAVSAVAPVPQGAPAADEAAQLTVEKLEAKKKQVAESQELSDDVKAKANDAYDKAIAQLKSAAELDKKKLDFTQARKGAPDTLTKTKELLAQQTAVTPPEAGPQITLTQAEPNLTAARLALEDAKKNVANWENEPKRRAERRTKIPEESNGAKQKLEEVKSKLAAPATEGQPAELVQANRTLLLAQQRVYESQIAANTEELLFYDAAGDLLAARRDLAARQQAAAEKVVEFWQQRVNDLRQKEAEAAKKEAIRAKEETKYDHPALKAIAEENAKLAGIQAELVTKDQVVTKYSEEIDGKLATVKKSFDEVRAKVETAGRVTGAMGMVLLGQREKLPHISANQKQMRGRPSEIALAQYNEMERDKEWYELIDLTDEIAAVLAQLDPSVGQAEREAVARQATSYYESRSKTLKAIVALYGDYSAKLANLDIKEGQYVETVQAYAAFIDVNILWVKSSLRLRASDLRTAASALRWLLSGGNWYRTATAFWADFKSNVSVYLASILVVLSLVVLRPKAHGAIKRLSERVRQVQTDSFWHTLKVLGLTVFLASAWPVVLFLLQWRLPAAAPDHDFSQALASGLWALMPVVFTLSFLCHFAMPHGLAQDHLRMRQEPLSFFRRLLVFYFTAVIPIALIVRITHVQQTGEQWYNSAGRLFFMADLILLALLLLLLLRPTGPLMEPYLKQKRGGWLERLRYLWYPLCFVLPGTFAVMAGMGYFYAARQLSEKFIITILLILLTILVRALFVRWLMVAQRRLALLERQKREAAEQQTQAQEADSASAEEPQQSRTNEDETTIFQISRQTRRLIDVLTVLVPLGGIWYVWSDVLPALSALAQTRLWSPGDEAVTLGSLATAVLVVALTVIVTRNVPGLLEIVILRRLPLDRGVRFAITTLLRYTLAVIGIVWACSKIGIGWSKVQWLIAAMTVGLGFGLQEIFANFVSGLIILFEQPIRVDDVVTIAEVTGRVSKIRIRATTIRRWDQRELVVPNKEFITGRLINWTLSDNVLRREFVVGIAYGSDIAKAERLLYEVARANPLVLKDPAPVVIFKGFGDNSLEFELRVYLAGIDNYVPVWHGINCAIDAEFRKAGIEIAFPQRDIHIRSIDASIPIDVNKPQG